MTEPGGESGPRNAGRSLIALQSVVSSAGEWLRLLLRYAWTRPLPYRVVGLLAVAYTIVVAVADEIALKRWLFGLVIGLLGWGWTRVALRVSAGDLQRYRDRGDNPADALLGLLLSRLPLPVARRVEFLMAAILVFAGLALAASSVFAL